MSKNFIVMWCCEGLEAIIDVEDIEHNNMLHAIKTGKLPKASLDHYVTMMTFRARVNTQRHYEIYAISAQEGIDEDDIREMFDNNPQYAADTCRRIGEMIYSDRVKEKPAII